VNYEIEFIWNKIENKIENKIYLSARNGQAAAGIERMDA
jgi:hypothetical protein